MSQIILGIDPGSARCGWGVIEVSDEGKMRLIEYGCTETPKDAGTGERLQEVYECICQVIAKHNPDCMAIEKLFFNRNITSGIAVAESRGVVLLAAQQAGIPVSEYTPSEIKETMTGDGRAKKKDIENMVVITLGLDKKPKPDDAADAVAIAITHQFWGGLNGQLAAFPVL